MSVQQDQGFVIILILEANDGRNFGSNLDRLGRLMVFFLLGNGFPDQLGELMRMAPPLAGELELSASASSCTGIGASRNDGGSRNCAATTTKQ